MQRFAYGAVTAALLLVASITYAGPITYNVNLTGAKEVTAAGVPNQGDPDALVTGTLTLDNGTGSGTTGSASFNLLISNLDFPVTGYHIHTGGPNTTGAILVNFQNVTPFESIRTGNTFIGTVNGLDAANITAIEANPGNFYFNMHNTPFPGGAVRDQVPEPAGLAIIALGGLLLARRPTVRPATARR
jgi:hypothetical protein